MPYEMFLSEDFYNKGTSIYEVIVAIAKRARQVSEEQRKEMDAYLTQVGMLEEGMEEEEPSPLTELQMLHAEPVLQFEKPSVLALREMIADKLEIHRPEKEATAEEGLESVEMGLETPGKIDLSGEEEESPRSGEVPTSLPGKLDLSE